MEGTKQRVYIKKLVLKNIKSHLDTTLEFSEGFNVICGEGDEGKSTISRVINWIATNGPVGYNPKPWKHLGAKGDSVAELHLSDGNVVSRIRGTQRNCYELNGAEFKALRGGVPDEVQKVLNLTDLNLQAQRKTFFLLEDTAGQVAKEFNKVCNLGNMDLAMARSKSRVRDRETEIKKLEKDLKETNSKIDELQIVKAVDSDLTELEGRQKSIEDLGLRVATLSTILDEITARKRELDQLPGDDFFHTIRIASTKFTELISNEKAIAATSQRKVDVEVAQQALKALPDDGFFVDCYDLGRMTKELQGAYEHLHMAGKLTEVVLSESNVVASFAFVPEMLGNVTRLRTCYDNLRSTSKAVSVASEKVAAHSDIAGEYDRLLEVTTLVSDIEGIAEDFHDLRSAHRHMSNVGALVQLVTGLHGEINTLVQETNKAEEDLLEVRRSIKICPLKNITCTLEV